MSTSYNSGVFVGVKLSEIGFNAKLLSNRFEVHDKKGKPTGKFDTEYSWEITYKGDVFVENGADFYEEYIDDILELEHESPLRLLNNNDDRDFDIDNFVIGVDITKKRYDDYFLLKELDLTKIDFVKNVIESQFGVDVEPKLYYFCSVS